MNFCLYPPPQPCHPISWFLGRKLQVLFSQNFVKTTWNKNTFIFLTIIQHKVVCWLDQFPTGQISTVFFEIIHGWCWPWSHSFRGSPESSLSSCWGAGWTTGASRPKSFSFASSWFGWSSLRKTPVPYMRLTVRKISFCCALLVLYHQVEKIYGS